MAHFLLLYHIDPDELDPENLRYQGNWWEDPIEIEYLIGPTMDMLTEGRYPLGDYWIVYGSALDLDQNKPTAIPVEHVPEDMEAEMVVLDQGASVYITEPFAHYFCRVDPFDGKVKPLLDSLHVTSGWLAFVDMHL